VDLGGPKEAQVQSYFSVGAIVPSWEGTLAPVGKYDLTIHLRWRCGLMSNYFNHLLLDGDSCWTGLTFPPEADCNWWLSCWVDQDLWTSRLGVSWLRSKKCGRWREFQIVL